jgi:cytochrome c oxidase subunit III
MTVILVFIVSAIVVALWWLVRQGLMTKPWLATGVAPVLQTGPGLSVQHAGLGIFLVVVGGLFALFGSAFVMRMDTEAWLSLTLPPIIWANTVQLILASLFLHMAYNAARRGDQQGLHRAAVVASLATLGFLIGQLLAWRDMTMGGDGLTTGPAASFFYILSGLHGLHILGGLGALGLVAMRRQTNPGRLTQGVGLCATYWDFLLIVWAGLLVLFLGWANQFVDICRGLLT